MSDIDTAIVDSLKVLDPKRPIREADMAALKSDVQRHERGLDGPTCSPTSVPTPTASVAIRWRVATVDVKL